MLELGRCAGVLLGLLLSVPCYLYLLLRLLVVGSKLWTVTSRRAEPPCLQDPRLGVHKYVKVNGVKLHYVEAGSERDEHGELRPLMVCVHGFPEFWYVWRHQLQHFSGRGYRVVALDIRGYGDSDKPVGLSKYHVKEYVEDIRQLVQHLGVATFTLVGHDWGGAISWTFSALHPGLLDNLVICNCPHMAAIRGAGLEQKIKSWYFIFFQVPWLPELFAMAEDMRVLDEMLADGGLKLGSEEVEAYKYNYRNCRQWTSAINLYRGAFTAASRAFWADPAMQQKVRNIRVRTLQIFGTGDKYLSVAGAVGSGQYVADHTLRLLEGASHWVQQQEPDTVNTMIQQFLGTKQ